MRIAIHCANGCKDSEEEIEAYERAIATNAMTEDNSAKAHSNLGITMECLRRDYRRAEEEYCKAIAIDPQCTGAFRNLAMLLGENLDRWPEARGAMAKAAALGDSAAKIELPRYERMAAAASGAASSAT